MKVRAKADGFIRVPTPKGDRSRLMEKGTVFELPKGTAIAPWMEPADEKPAATPAPVKQQAPAKPGKPEESDPVKPGTSDAEVI